jgi:hypothetical protein
MASLCGKSCAFVDVEADRCGDLQEAFGPQDYPELIEVKAWGGVESEDFGVGCVLEVHLNVLSRGELVGFRYFCGYFEGARTSAAYPCMYVLGFIVELSVGEEAGVESSASSVAYLLICRLLWVLLAHTDFDHGADPLVLFVGLDLDKEKPFVAFHLLHILLANAEYVSACECGLLSEILRVGRVEFEVLVFLGGYVEC